MGLHWLLERGKVVRERTKDTWGLWRKGALDPIQRAIRRGRRRHFSDGKLYSQIGDPPSRPQGAEGIGRAGALPEILTEAHPHRHVPAVTMVEHARNHPLTGGEYRFGHRVEDIEISTAADGTRTLRGIYLHTGEYVETEHAILAVGHSAREAFRMLHGRGVTWRQPFPSACDEHLQSGSMSALRQLRRPS